ncbi:chromosomal replication initiator protein DnaA [Candidatus Peregrinibacteria bacterium]|nr:chromosomal replication initiator protein DnaA [Candidatus Peregrinibacteria bacterium]
MAHKDFWLNALKRLQPTIKKAHFITWFQNTSVIDKKENKLIIGVPTSFAKDWIVNKYTVKIEQAVKELDPTVSEIEFEVCSRLSDKGSNEGVNVKKLLVDSGDTKKVRKNRKSNEITVTKGITKEKIQSQLLNDRYQLDNFVIGVDNRLPHAAATAVSNTPGGIYNPFYIYGSVGLGKTHLVQAIGNEIIRNFPEMVVKYITAERFVTEVVEAIGKRHMHKFKEQYRNVDVFLIDDVQFFARKHSSQQEFFHTFNALYDNNKQIILTSDRPPSELDDLDDRLKSRFGMGMVVELLKPDFETRVAILKQKCTEFETLIDPEVLEFIANNVTDSVRGLEGVLRQAIAESELAQRVPTIKSVAEIIKKLNKAQEIIGYDIENKRNARIVKNSIDIMNIVAEYYDITVDDLIGKDRHKEIMMPRQICMYLIKNELGESYEKIGHGFGGRNHTTVMHACNKLSKQLKKDVRLVRDINSIKREMGL